jgi:hypothetical protein
MQRGPLKSMGPEAESCIRATTPEIEDEGEERIEESMNESESDYIIVASSRWNLR